jgi:hypothetical protein
LTDFLDDRRAEISSRLAELEPLVDEYHRIQAAVEALDGILVSSNGASVSVPLVRRRQRRSRPRGTKPAAASLPVAPVAPSTTKPTAARGRRKGTGKRAAQALALVQHAPGVTIPELAASMGTHPTYLYRVLPALAKEGKVRKEDRGWYSEETTPASS